VEIVSSSDPHVIVFHDIIQDEEIEYLRSFAGPRLSQQRIKDDEEGGDEEEYGKK